METYVFVAVLIAAACHASWNAVIKFGLDPFTTTALIAIMSGVVAAPLVPVFGLPPAAAWPWVIASVILHRRAHRGGGAARAVARKPHCGGDDDRRRVGADPAAVRRPESQDSAPHKVH